MTSTPNKLTVKSTSGKLSFGDSLSAFKFSETVTSTPPATRTDVTTFPSKNQEPQVDIPTTPPRATPLKTTSLRKSNRKRSNGTLQDSDDDDVGVNEKKKNSSSSPRKRAKKEPLGPEAYKDLKPLPDRLGDNLHVIICGCNPGVKSSREGFHYAHPSNRLYKVLSRSGFTNGNIVKPSDSPTFPETYNIGFTDIVERPTRELAELSAKEFSSGIPGFIRKIIKCRPRMVIFTAIKIFDHFQMKFSSLNLPKKFSYETGFIVPFKLLLPNDGETWFVVSPGVSGLVSHYQEDDLVGIWKEAHRVAEVLKAEPLGSKTRLDEEKIVAQKHGLSKMKTTEAEAWLAVHAHTTNLS